MQKINVLTIRFKAAGLHLVASAGVVATTAALVFHFWYPAIYRSLSGGTELFLLVTAIDMVLGPFLTLAVFDIRKPRGRLLSDLAIVAAFQLSALAYGLNTVYIARPVVTVFEVDRLRVLITDQIRLIELVAPTSRYHQLPLDGPLLLGTRTLAYGAERNDALFMAVDGYDIAQRPIYWQSYEASKPAILLKARPVAALFAQYPLRADELRSSLRAQGADADSASYLPLMARGDWVAVINAQGDWVASLAADGFF